MALICHWTGKSRFETRSGRNYNDVMLLEGIFAAVTTCFYPDGRPYWRKLEANMERYSRTADERDGVAGLDGRSRDAER